MTPEERKAINKTRCLFGKSTTETREFFESIGIAAVLSYMEKEPILIPNIGEIEIVYKGDKDTPTGREAILETKFTPSNFLVRVVGQVEDNVKTDAEEILLKRLWNIFKKKSK